MGRLDLLRRALDAEAEADELRARMADSDQRLRAALNADPTTATRALSWIGRAEAAEALLREVQEYVERRLLSGTDLPDGWVARADAQLRSVKLLQRDQAALAEKPQESWAEYTERESGRRGILRNPL